MNTIEKLKALACKEPYNSDGLHLGLNPEVFDEYGLAMELEFGEEIYKRVLEKKPDTILELGTANGYSTSWFLLGVQENKKGQVISVDKEDRQPKVWDIIDLIPKELRLVIRETGDFFDDFNELVDMVLLDTEHRYETVTKDIELVLPFLNPGAVLFIHDTYADPELGKQLKDYFLKKGNFDYESIDKSCGLAIATLKN